jgi:hypothetical protein
MSALLLSDEDRSGVSGAMVVVNFGVCFYFENSKNPDCTFLQNSIFKKPFLVLDFFLHFFSDLFF